MRKKKPKKTPRWGISEAGGLVATAALTGAVVRLLRSPAAQKVDFVFNAIIVSGPRLRELARAIEQFEIVVYHDPKCVKVPSAFDGYYSGADDAMYLGFKHLAAMDNRLLTLHECVHAVNDLYGSAGVSQLDDECAGYVACALYYRHAGHKYPQRPKAALPLVDAVYQAAFDLADAYLDRVVNPFAEVQALRAAVLAVPIYKKAAGKRMTYGGFNHTLRSGEYALAAALRAAR
jgi:hypothetical protein